MTSNNSDLLLSARFLAPVSFEEDRAIASVMETQSNLGRHVYCVLGVPVDAVNLSTVIQKIEAAAAHRVVFLISTPNLNFLMQSLSDPEFRESLLDSDLCPPDGAPIIWIARLLGLPIAERAAGADLLDRLDKLSGPPARPLKIFLFGGAKGVAAAAAERLNRHPGGLTCVGTMNPGFGDVGDMSQDHMIAAINSSGADFLVVSLGAKKGQLWLRHNKHRLTIPVRSHLGAAINFQAGTLKRAPPIVRAWGLEWLWRIKEEPYLWKRYLADGFGLLRLLSTRVLPLVIITRWYQFRRIYQQDLQIDMRQDYRSFIISLCGIASEKHIPKAVAGFQEALASNKNVTIDLSKTRVIDARFFGLLLMLRKDLKIRGAKLIFTGMSRGVKRLFSLSELRFLLSENAPD